ncbi:MAG: hypothetical protein AAF624_11615 [Bacteroidota bacterium]
MASTLYALIAVFAFSILGLTIHRHVNDTERSAITSELESAGLDVALAWANRVKDYAFDEADVGELGMRAEGDVAGLAAPTNLGPEAGEADPATFDDVDDFNGYAFVVSQPVAGGVQDFAVSFVVRYVDPLDFEVGSTTTTTAKEVAVVVRAVEATSDRPPVVASLAVPLTPAKLFLHQ